MVDTQWPVLYYIIITVAKHARNIKNQSLIYSFMVLNSYRILVTTVKLVQRLQKQENSQKCIAHIYNPSLLNAGAYMTTGGNRQMFPLQEGKIKQNENQKN